MLVGADEEIVVTDEVAVTATELEVAVLVLEVVVVAAPKAITETVLGAELATNISFLPESYAMPSGYFPTIRVETAELVVSLITETVFAPASATKTSPSTG